MNAKYWLHLTSLLTKENCCFVMQKLWMMVIIKAYNIHIANYFPRKEWFAQFLNKLHTNVTCVVFHCLFYYFLFVKVLWKCNYAIKRSWSFKETLVAFVSYCVWRKINSSIFFYLSSFNVNQTVDLIKNSLCNKQDLSLVKLWTLIIKLYIPNNFLIAFLFRIIWCEHKWTKLLKQKSSFLQII